MSRFGSKFGLAEGQLRPIFEELKARGLMFVDSGESGSGAMARIAEERAKNGPFKDLIDFAERVDLKQVGKRSLENLARAGALDGLCASRAQAFASAELLIRTSAAHQEEQQSDQGGLFALDDVHHIFKMIFILKYLSIIL